MIAASQSSLSNIERILQSEAPKNKATYLPPKILSSYQSSLVYIPTRLPKTSLPTFEEISSKNLYIKNGVLLTPPGLGIANYFEKKLGRSFLELNLSQLQTLLPKLLEKLEVTKDFKIILGDTDLKVEVHGTFFDRLCAEAGKLPLTHEAMGCPFSSALAIVFTRTTNKPIIIRDEIKNSETKTTKIIYEPVSE
jgi:hypothetical protein